MSDVKRLSLWERRSFLTPVESALLGLMIGSAAAIVAAFTPPRDFSYSYLLLLLLTIGSFGGIAGYMFWLAFDPVRERRLLRITSVVALLAIIGLFAAFPGFWWELVRTKGFHTVYLVAA